MRTFPSFVAFWAIGLSLAGCGMAVSSEPQQQGTVVIALDTSASARQYHEQMFNQAVEQSASLPLSVQLIVFRFDSSPAEVHVGKPFADQAEAGRKLKTELEWHSNTRGTNLAKLFSRVDALLEESPAPVVVEVYTDCGTELMGAKDDETVRRVTESWDAKGIRVRFHGVASGHREKLRDLIRCPLQID